MDKLTPAPVRKIPILIGGGGEKKTLRYTARHADVWHSWWGDQWAHKNSVLDDWCAKEGRDPGAIARSVGVDWDKIDDASGVYAEIAAAGIDEITLGCGGPDYDMSGVEAFVAAREGA